MAAAVVVAVLNLQPVSATADPTSASLATPAAQWPKYHYDLASTGFNPRETILSPSNVGDMVVKWAFPAGDVLLGSPVVVDGVVYTEDVDGMVYAVNAATGTQVWTHALGKFGGAASISHGLLFVATGSDDKVYALDAATGEERWSFTDGLPTGAPLVVGNTVYVGTMGGELYALRVSDGVQRWRSTFVGGIDKGLAWAGGTIYGGDTIAGCARAFNARNGRVRWSTCVDDTIPGTPTVAGNRVFVAARNGSLYALDSRTGAILWSVDTGAELDSSAATAYGMVFIGGSIDGRIYAFTQDCPDPCSAIWSFQTGDGAGESMVVANGVVYAGSKDDTIYALDVLTGVQLWSYATTGFGWFAKAPAVLDGVLYAASYDHNLYAFSLPSGD